MNAEKRTIFVGDIHGCFDELKELVQLCEHRPGVDRLIFLGDVFNRGPGSLQVFLKMREWKAESVLGNHEMAILKSWNSGNKSSRWYQKTLDEFGEHYTDMIKAINDWPLFIEEEDFIALHAGIVPGKKLREMSADEITSIRMWKNPENPVAPPTPWFEHYKEEKPVIFGHWGKLEGVQRDNAHGIDTGCVYGKRLTALIWPEKKRVTVPAKKAYFSINE